MTTANPLLVGLVGPCASGKSTLAAGLEARGIRARHIAQEHSHVPDMWRRITNPDVLIFLDASYPVTIQRRNLNWLEKEWAEQQRRLSHARQHADLYVDTDTLSVEAVLSKVMDFLSQLR
jgi:cytidylate kinase